MKIAIDITQVIYQTGVSVYTRQLVDNLLKIDGNNNYLLYGGSLRRRQELKKFVSQYQSVETKILPISPTLADIFWNRLNFPKIEVVAGKVDVFHSSDWAQPSGSSFMVTTVHDLFPVKFRDLVLPKVAAVHKRKLERSLKIVNAFIVPSKATRNELVTFGADKNKIHVIAEAVSSANFKPQPKTKIENLKKKYEINGEFILSVGVGQRKNTQRIIEAFTKAKSSELKLVIIGRRQEEFKGERGVIFTGHVPTAELPIFYSGAKALVYPSLYEGFGLPILDAMACHCPVITSNISSMPEVAGNAAILVDPFDVGAISEGIKNVLNAPKTFINKGKSRVNLFSWKKVAKETLKVYELAQKL